MGGKKCVDCIQVGEMKTNHRNTEAARFLRYMHAFTLKSEISKNSEYTLIRLFIHMKICRISENGRAHTLFVLVVFLCVEHKWNELLNLYFNASKKATAAPFHAFTIAYSSTFKKKEKAAQLQRKDACGMLTIAFGSRCLQIQLTGHNWLSRRSRKLPNRRHRLTFWDQRPNQNQFHSIYLSAFGPVVHLACLSFSLT